MGGTYIYGGEIKHSDAEEGGFLDINKSLFVYLVRTSFLGKPLRVSEGNITVKEKWPSFALRGPEIPFSSSGHSMDEKQRIELKQIMVNVPRDSKGRWLKG